jgi:hypothetical protein
MAMFGGMFSGNGFGMDFGGDSGAGGGTGGGAPAKPGFNDPGGLGEKLGMAGSAILGAYNGGAGALNLDTLRKLHQQRGGGVPPAPPIAPPAMLGTQAFNGNLQIDPLTGQYRSILRPGVPT